MLYAILIVLSSVFSFSAKAEETLFRRCEALPSSRYYNPSSAAWGSKPPRIECVVSTNNLVINKVVVNRGNCNLHDYRKEPFNFGSTLVIVVLCDQNILELDIFTNKGNMRFTW